MLPKERIYRIMELIQKKGFVTVMELMSELKTSRSSIMRDLIQLEKENLIQREHGGASKKETMKLLTPFHESTVLDKRNKNVEIKEKLCLKASEFIEDGQCIFIDAGTTTMHLLPYIQHKKITIVTSSIYLIRNLPENFSGNVFILGGQFNSKHDMALGTMTLEFLNQFNFDYAFLSTGGIDLKQGEVYISDYEVGTIKRNVIQRSQKTCLLVDDSKFVIKGQSSWGKLNQFDTIICNNLPTNYKKLKQFMIVN